MQWEDIIDVRPIRWSLAGDTLVRARRISPVHRLYGWMYSHSLFPSFVIGRDIEQREELLAEIERRIHQP